MAEARATRRINVRSGPGGVSSPGDALADWLPAVSSTIRRPPNFVPLSLPNRSPSPESSSGKPAVNESLWLL